MLYVSPSFTEALDLASEHQPHLNWLLQVPPRAPPCPCAAYGQANSAYLLQSCFLGLVATQRYDTLVANAYHLLQAAPPCRHGASRSSQETLTFMFAHDTRRHISHECRSTLSRSPSGGPQPSAATTTS